jgi:hypothetical protein
MSEVLSGTLADMDGDWRRNIIEVLKSELRAEAGTGKRE